jgi:hypothetical protein
MLPLEDMLLRRKCRFRLIPGLCRFGFVLQSDFNVWKVWSVWIVVTNCHRVEEINGIFVCFIFLSISRRIKHSSEKLRIAQRNTKAK